MLERLGEDVSYLILGLHVFNLYILSFDALPYVMVASINMLATIMEYWILCKSDG